MRLLPHAGATRARRGRSGPNLDAAFGRFARAGTRREHGPRGRPRPDPLSVAPHRALPGFPVMPANLVTGSDADAVAAYVASRGRRRRRARAAARRARATAGRCLRRHRRPRRPADDDHRTDACRRGCAKGKSLFASLAARAATRSTDRAASGQRAGPVRLEGRADDGKTATADDAYLLEAIEDPTPRSCRATSPAIMSGSSRIRSPSRTRAT